VPAHRVGQAFFAVIGGIEVRLDPEATAALDKASAWREA
jgi:hypothetical protein